MPISYKQFHLKNFIYVILIDAIFIYAIFIYAIMVNEITIYAIFDGWIFYERTTAHLSDTRTR